MNRKNNSGDFDQKMESPEPRLFERWIAKNNVLIQTPVIIQNSFRNLEDPIEFIRDEGIIKLEQRTKNLEQHMKYQRQLVSQISKLNYKKVISRDKVEYQFGNAAIQRNMVNPSHYFQFQKRSAKKTDDNQKLFVKRQQLKKEFVHGSTKHKYGDGIQQTALTMDFIRDIDTKDFQKYKHYEFYDVFSKEIEQEKEKYPSGATDISDNYDMDQLFNKIRFNLIDRDSQYSAKSSQYLFKADEELDFWRKNADTQQPTVSTQQIEVMKRCQNFNIREPSFLHLLDFAAGKIDGQILAYFFKLKARHQTQMKLNENDQNLEEEYTKKKKQLDDLRELKRNDKTHRVNVRTAKNTAQTIDNLEDQSFDSYFEESAKDIILKIRQLNKIRDSLIESQEEQQKTMLVNIGHQIKNLLFRLLTLILKGENFINYEEIILIEDQGLAEKKILQIIYHDFQKVQTNQVDGISKTKMLEIYLEQRERNQKIFQLLGRNHAKEKKQTKIRKKK